METCKDDFPELPTGRSRKSIHIACEEMDFTWSIQEVREFRTLWRAGVSVQDIAKYFNRDEREVEILIIDQFKSGKAKSTMAEELNKSKKAIASIIRTDEDDNPTLIMIGGKRYAVKRPGERSDQDGKVNSSRKSAKRKPYVQKRKSRKKANESIVG